MLRFLGTLVLLSWLFGTTMWGAFVGLVWAFVGGLALMGFALTMGGRARRIEGQPAPSLAHPLERRGASEAPVHPRGGAPAERPAPALDGPSPLANVVKATCVVGVVGTLLVILAGH